MDIAASIQSVLETILIKITKSIYKEYKIKNLCLAGGVALNCVANGKIIKQSGFKNIDSTCLWRCWWCSWSCFSLLVLPFKRKRIPTKTDSMRGSYLGSEYTNSQIEEILKNKKN